MRLDDSHMTIANRAIVALLLVLLLATGLHLLLPGAATTSVSGTNTAATPMDFSAVAAKVLPSCVYLRVGESLFDANQNAMGSGIVYKSNGRMSYIVTARHVVSGGKVFTAISNDGIEYPAKVIYEDAYYDIALLSIDSPLPAATFADSDQLRVGASIISIGSPYQFRNTVTSGIVSALHRYVNNATVEGGAVSYSLVNVIQQDSGTNPGNSGGPLVDAQGGVVGINSAIYSENGSNASIAFAVPSNTVRRILDEYMNTGAAAHPYIGIGVADVSPQVAKDQGLSVDHGTIVMSVDATGPAMAVLRVGDIILALDGKNVFNMGELLSSIDAAGSDKQISLSVLRGGARIEQTLTTGKKSDGS